MIRKILMSHRRTMSPGSVMLSLLLGVPPLAVCAETSVVSVSTAGDYGNDFSTAGDISNNGRYATFASYSTNLVPEPASGSQIYQHDRKTHTTTLISLGISDLPANGDCSYPASSSNGKVIAYLSVATNLSGGDLNNSQDVFVFDAETQSTVKVSSTPAGGDAMGTAYDCDISGNGRYVVFTSSATNLVMSDTNASTDIFLHDRTLNTTVLVSMDAQGNPSNGDSYSAVISSDGRFVAFTSQATNLVPNDTNSATDIFVKDTKTNAIERVSVTSIGTQANDFNFLPTISDDGRYVAFESWAENFVEGDTNGSTDVYLHDRKKHTTTCVSVGNDPFVGVSGAHPRISGNGRFVLFESTSTLVGADGTNSAALLRDIKLGKTAIVSVSAEKVLSNDDVGSGAVSRNGRYVMFDALASNLSSNDMNADWDVFVRDRKLKK